MDDSIVVPWDEVVRLKQARDTDLLETIRHYQVIAESSSVSELSRIEARKLMKQYQRIYLGLPHGI